MELTLGVPKTNLTKPGFPPVCLVRCATNSNKRAFERLLFKSKWDFNGTQNIRVQSQRPDYQA